MLDVGALVAFVAVIDTGSFSGAAERLGQTPSGVSRTIARLEKQLGMTLIHRTTRRLDLTEEGSWRRWPIINFNARAPRKTVASGSSVVREAQLYE